MKLIPTPAPLECGEPSPRVPRVMGSPQRLDACIWQELEEPPEDQLDMSKPKAIPHLRHLDTLNDELGLLLMPDFEDWPDGHSYDIYRPNKPLIFLGETFRWRDAAMAAALNYLERDAGAQLVEGVYIGEHGTGDVFWTTGQACAAARSAFERNARIQEKSWFPAYPRRQWQHYCRGTGEPLPQVRLRKLSEIEAIGCEVATACGKLAKIEWTGFDVWRRQFRPVAGGEQTVNALERLTCEKPEL